MKRLNRLSGRGALARIRKICLSLPETSERLSHGAPTFFIRRKRAFVMFHDNHHGDGRLAIWCAAPHDVQRMLVEGAPHTTSSRPTSDISAGSACASTGTWAGMRSPDSLRMRI